MNNGISIYAGLNTSVDENISLIENAATLGFSRIFTSVNIPETDSDGSDFAIILATAISNGFEVILDISPQTLTTFDFALDFDEITPRLDDGFNPMQIAALSHIRRIMLNASTVTKDLLLNLVELNADFNNISALHNFYPQIYSGLDVDYFKAQNQLLHDFGIQVGAFTQSLYGRRRPPLSEGLPTVELTRNFSTDFSAKFLHALGADFIIISDSLPTLEECTAVANLSKDVITLNAEFSISGDLQTAVKEYLSKTFITRQELSPYIIRAANSRLSSHSSHLQSSQSSQHSSQTSQSFTSELITDDYPVRKFGDITINNSQFGRYAGEVQIVKSDIPADPRVTTVAHVTNPDFLLIEYIGSNQAFAFTFN